MASAAVSTSASGTQPASSAATIIRASCGSSGSCAIVRPTGVRPRPVVSAARRTEFVQQGQHRRRPAGESGGSRNGNVAMSPRSRSAICSSTEASEVRRISGSVNTGRPRSPPPSTAGCTRRRRRDRTGPRVAGRTPARSVRSAAAAPWSWRRSGRSAPFPGRSRTGCRARSTRSRRRWWPAPRVGWSAARTRGAARRPTAAPYSGTTSTGSRLLRRCPRSTSAVSRISRSPDRNTSTSPSPARPSSSTAATDRLGLVGRTASAVRRVRLGRLPWPVAHLDRIRPAGHLDHRCVAEVCAEPAGVDRRGRDDQLQVGPLRQQADQVSEQEVDVEASFVGLVQDDRVVPGEQPVAGDFGEQDAVGHQFDQRVRSGVVAEPDGVADQAAELGAGLLRDALGERAGGDAPRLGVADQAADTATEVQADLGQLGGFAGAGLARPPRRPDDRGSRP